MQTNILSEFFEHYSCHNVIDDGSVANRASLACAKVYVWIWPWLWTVDFKPKSFLVNWSVQIVLLTEAPCTATDLWCMSLSLSLFLSVFLPSFLLLVFCQEPEEHLWVVLLCPEGCAAPHRTSLLSWGEGGEVGGKGFQNPLLTTRRWALASFNQAAEWTWLLLSLPQRIH